MDATNRNRATAKKITAKPVRAAAAARIDRQRLQFRELIVAYPDYFKDKKGNISYEELKCAGFNPETRHLEAVVHVKKESGYGGNLCSGGSREYVRFFLSYDDGATWLDQGMTGFEVYDVPGKKPLEYGVRLPVSPPEHYCRFENLPRVRAILSWNMPPTPDDPDYAPVYGNRIDNHVQIGAAKFLLMKDFLKVMDIEVSPAIKDLVDLEQQVVPKPPKGPGPVELAAMYMKNDVQPQRLLFNEIQMAVKQPSFTSAMGIPSVQSTLKEFKVNLASVIEALNANDGDTGYEELNCIGMCHSAIDWLTATFKIKRPCGYKGNLCSPGSKEYVAFWVDWGDGAGWSYAGTGAVTVHDLSKLPAGGVEYSVSIPVNTVAHRRPCNEGPKTARVRAILSWEAAPPPGNPEFVPHWGNREETLVLIKPGPAVVPADNRMYVDSVGNMAVCDIDKATGLASGAGQIAAFTAIESPFGGEIRMTGFIIDPPNAMADPSKTLKYRVSIRRLDDAGIPVTGWQPLTNDFDIVITEQNGVGLPVQYHHTQQIDSEGFYTYWEQVYPNQWRQVVMDKIASWQTLGQAPGLREIKVEVKVPGLPVLLPPGEIACKDGTKRSIVRVRLDEKAPSAHIAITGFIYGGKTLPASSCGTFIKGGTIVGEYSTFDPESHWGSRTITVAPAGPAHSTPVAIFPAASGTDGESGKWTLDTSNMDPCGYIVYLWTEDRTIVNSGFIGWENGASAGFCLKLED